MGLQRVKLVNFYYKIQMCAVFWTFSGSYLPIAEQKTPVLYSKIGTFVSISGFTARKIWRNSCRLGEGNISILSEEPHPIRSRFFLHSELYRTVGTRKLSIISADPRQLDPLFLSSFFFSTPEAFCSNVLRTKRCKPSEKNCGVAPGSDRDELPGRFLVFWFTGVRCYSGSETPNSTEELNKCRRLSCIVHTTL